MTLITTLVANASCLPERARRQAPGGHLPPPPLGETMTIGVSIADGGNDAVADTLGDTLGDADALAEALGDSGVAVFPFPVPLPLPPAFEFEFEFEFAAAAITIGGVFNSSITPGTVVAPTTPETGSP